MTDDPAHETKAQRWSVEAHQTIEARGTAGLADILAPDFVQETHRGRLQRVSRAAFLETARSLREMDLHVAGAPIAVAGEHCVLTRRSYVHSSVVVELLAVSVWNDDSRLTRLIEFGADALDEALAELSGVAGHTAVML
jgi:hypothetical protein